jgi:magnesium-transporting ATPase (P-type)
MKIFPSTIVMRGSFKRQIILAFVVGFFFLITTFAVYLVNREKGNLYRDSVDETTGLADPITSLSQTRHAKATSEFSPKASSLIIHWPYAIAMAMLLMCCTTLVFIAVCQARCWACLPPRATSQNAIKLSRK